MEVIKAQQAQQAPQTVQPPTTPNVPPSPEVVSATTEAVEQKYPIDQAEHWIAIVLDQGAQVKLNDGSIWEIARQYQTQTMTWTVSDKIVVTQNPDRQYPFKLVNNTKRTAASARLATAR